MEAMERTCDDETATDANMCAQKANDDHAKGARQW